MIEKERTLVSKDVREVVVHRVAEMHRLMNEAEYAALLSSIRERGQTVPVIFYRGKLVDGRHRLRALLELGISKIVVDELNNNMTIEDVIDLVMDTEIRRTDTVAQKAIKAYGWIKNGDKRTQKDASTKFAVPQARISEAKKIEEMMGTNSTEELYAKGFLYINGKKYVQLIQIIKALSPDTKPIRDAEPITDLQTKGFEVMAQAYIDNDMITLAKIVTRGKNLMNKLNEN